MTRGLNSAISVASQYVKGKIRARRWIEVVSVIGASAERGDEYSAKHGNAFYMTDLVALTSNSIMELEYFQTEHSDSTSDCWFQRVGQACGLSKLQEMNVEDPMNMTRLAGAAEVVIAEILAKPPGLIRKPRIGSTE